MSNASWRSVEGWPRFRCEGAKRDDLVSGLRTIGFERRITKAFMVAEDAIVIEGIFYGGRDFEAVFQQ
jgi:toxin ParE1/3/4